MKEHQTIIVVTDIDSIAAPRNQINSIRLD